MSTYEALSLMLSFGMLVIAILKFKDNDKNTWTRWICVFFLMANIILSIYYKGYRPIAIKLTRTSYPKSKMHKFFVHTNCSCSNPTFHTYPSLAYYSVFYLFSPRKKRKKLIIYRIFPTTSLTAHSKKQKGMILWKFLSMLWIVYFVRKIEEQDKQLWLFLPLLTY